MALRGIFTFINMYLAEAISQGVSYRIRNMLYDKLQHLSFAFHDREHTGNLMSKATVDVEMTRMFVSMGLIRSGQIVTLTIGAGQRLGIFAGAGHGKSTLLAMMARYTSADVNVIALVGERGREVHDFLEQSLGAEGLRRSVVVVATSDEPPLLRIKAAYVATAIAEFFRDQGKNVLFLMDSVTRFARGQREVGLATGEPPARGGFPPSVFAVLPRLLERTGNSDRGSITALYTVLVEGDDLTEPVADETKSILDGHIVLSGDLAARGHFPAIDVLKSASRLFETLSTQRQRALVYRLRDLLAAYERNRDLILIGAYQAGTEPLVDGYLVAQHEIQGFLRQGIEERSDLATALNGLEAALGGGGQA